MHRELKGGPTKKQSVLYVLDAKLGSAPHTDPQLSWVTPAAPEPSKQVTMLWEHSRKAVLNLSQSALAQQLSESRCGQLELSETAVPGSAYFECLRLTMQFGQAFFGIMECIVLRYVLEHKLASTEQVPNRLAHFLML